MLSKLRQFPELERIYLGTFEFCFSRSVMKIFITGEYFNRKFDFNFDVPYRFKLAIRLTSRLTIKHIV